MAKKIKFLSLPILIAAGLLFLFERGFIPGLSQQSDPYKSFRQLSTVIQLVRNDYVDEPDPARTMEGALKGLVDSLDILSSYLNPAQVELYRRRLAQELMEPGIVLYKTYGSFPVVIAVKPDSPAAAHGISPGDTIGAIDGISTLTMSMTEANLMLKHTGSRAVELKIMGANQDEFITLERKRLQQAPFSFSQAEGTAGILKVHAFLSPLVRRIKEEVMFQIREAEDKPLILDFRTCNEGTFSESVKFINLFIKENNIGYLERRGDSKERVSCPEKAYFTKSPLVVWTDPATMGPSEVAALVLKQFRNAKIIGHQTIGLGAQQTLYVLDDGSGVLLTAGVFIPRNKNRLWLQGLEPDVKLQRNVLDQAAFLKETHGIFPNR